MLSTLPTMPQSYVRYAPLVVLAYAGAEVDRASVDAASRAMHLLAWLGTGGPYARYSSANASSAQSTDRWGTQCSRSCRCQELRDWSLVTVTPSKQASCRVNDSAACLILDDNHPKQAGIMQSQRFRGVHCVCKCQSKIQVFVRLQAHPGAAWLPGHAVHPAQQLGRESQHCNGRPCQLRSVLRGASAGGGRRHHRSCAGQRCVGHPSCRSRVPGRIGGGPTGGECAHPHGSSPSIQLPMRRCSVCTSYSLYMTPVMSSARARILKLLYTQNQGLDTCMANGRALSENGCGCGGHQVGCS